MSEAQRLYTGDVVQIKPDSACPAGYHGLVAVVSEVYGKHDIEVAIRAPTGDTYLQRLQYPDDCVRLGFCQWSYQVGRV